MGKGGGGPDPYTSPHMDQYEEMMNQGILNRAGARKVGSPGTGIFQAPLMGGKSTSQNMGDSAHNFYNYGKTLAAQNSPGSQTALQPDQNGIIPFMNQGTSQQDPQEQLGRLFGSIRRR